MIDVLSGVLAAAFIAAIIGPFLAFMLGMLATILLDMLWMVLRGTRYAERYNEALKATGSLIFNGTIILLVSIAVFFLVLYYGMALYG